MAKSYPPAFELAEVDGKKVIRNEVMRSNLPPLADGTRPPMHTIRVLTLEDESVVYGCRDCEVTGAGPGEIRAHRHRDHGVVSEHRRSPVNTDAASSPPLPMPHASMLGMTLYEMLELSANIASWEQVFANDQAEIERLRNLVTEKDQELAEKNRLLKTEQREHEKTRNRIAKALGLDKPAAADDKPEDRS